MISVIRYWGYSGDESTEIETCGFQPQNGRSICRWNRRISSSPLGAMAWNRSHGCINCSCRSTHVLATPHRGCTQPLFDGQLQFTIFQRNYRSLSTITNSTAQGDRGANGKPIEVTDWDAWESDPLTVRRHFNLCDCISRVIPISHAHLSWHLLLLHLLQLSLRSLTSRLPSIVATHYIVLTFSIAG